MHALPEGAYICPHDVVQARSAHAMVARQYAPALDGAHSLFEADGALMGQAQPVFGERLHHVGYLDHCH